MSKQKLAKIGRTLHQLENHILDTDEVDFDRLKTAKILGRLSDQVSNLAYEMPDQPVVVKEGQL